MKKIFSVFCVIIVLFSVFATVATATETDIFDLVRAKAESNKLQTYTDTAISNVLATIYSGFSASDKQKLIDYYKADKDTRQKMYNEAKDNVMRQSYNNFINYVTNEISALQQIDREKEKEKSEDEDNKTWVEQFITTYIAKPISEQIANVWGDIGSSILNGDTVFGGVKVKDFDTANTLIHYFKMVAFALAYIFWLIGIMNEGLKYELFTIKSGAKIFLGIIFIYALINFSVDICYWVIAFNDKIATFVVSSHEVKDAFARDLQPTITNTVIDVVIAKAPFGIGHLMTMINGMFNGQNTSIIICLVVILVGLIVIEIKLFIRQIKMMCMVVISPMFFGCAVNETTRPYFRNFINEFLSIVTQTIFMALVLTLGSAVVVSLPNDLTGIIGRTIVIWAMVIMICKPPKFLTGLVSR